ncbi:alpha/beta hydrolase [Luteolibacter yonseiensis]|uniref:Alpha/beta hydrolase n=1 Tax=Luteolibacter yonseiensis TaxID=1144680 RepID=A0A934R3U5_9BACT|nr:alpha/beta hydrolase [Luteolibacter yonseiensis]MBK1815791.1 alpha/beta hydrolase [Luteolibacter yonseiensis]
MRSTALFITACLFPIASPARAQDAGLEKIPALDATLAGYAYPFEVKTLPLTEQGRALSMAYMDLKPEGTPNGKTVLLLHGKNFSGAYWERTAKDLSTRGFRVVIPDQIGFGKSSKPVDIQYSFQMMAAQTKTLLDHLELESVEVVGHSMGGMVATRFALMFPDLTEKLVLVNPIGLEDWKRKIPYQSIDEATAAEMKKTPQDVKDYMRNVYFDGKWKDEYDSLLTVQAGWLKGADKATLARVTALTSDMVVTQPVLYEFPDIKEPTLLVIGERDRTAIGKNLASKEVAATMGQYQELGKTTAAAIHGAKLVALPGVGHMPQVEAYDEYFKALVDFL